MLSFFRKRATYANVAMTVALVFAMSGGAFAAGKYLITSTKQISPKVLKSLHGADGKNGAAGPAGPAGATGPQGAQGATGPQGPAGAAGTTGEPGAEGKEGKAGKNGSPWTAGGTLPVGATETGVLATPAPSQFSEGEVFLPISFTIPLATDLGAGQVEVVKVGATGTHCTGSPDNPTAPSAFLCVYLAQEPGPEGVIEIIQGGYGISPVQSETQGSSRSGAIFTYLVNGQKANILAGAWAVTG